MDLLKLHTHTHLYIHAHIQTHIRIQTQMHTHIYAHAHTDTLHAHVHTPYIFCARVCTHIQVVRVKVENKDDPLLPCRCQVGEVM
jgi:hypothetical protein